MAYTKNRRPIERRVLSTGLVVTTYSRKHAPECHLRTCRCDSRLWCTCGAIVTTDPDRRAEGNYRFPV